MSLLQWNNYNYAGNFYNLRRGAHYIIPKPKFLYYVDFKVSPYGKKILSNTANRRLGFMVKAMDRPSISYTQQEMNQYNRKRLVTTGVSYGAVNINIHDTIDEPALKLLLDYSSYYYNDFKYGKQTWRYDVVPPTHKTTQAGYSPRNGASDIYFFESIDCYEWYNGYYTKYSLVNPKFESVQFSSLDMQSGAEGGDVTFVIRPEGVVWEQVSAPITREVSELFGLPWKEGSTDTFRPHDGHRTTGIGIPNEFNDALDSFIIGGLGSFIDGSYGNLSHSVADMIGDIASSTINNFMYQSGFGGFTNPVNSLIGMGTRNLSNILSGIF